MGHPLLKVLTAQTSKMENHFFAQAAFLMRGREMGRRAQTHLRKE
jgi:hypothetical protein